MKAALVTTGGAELAVAPDRVKLNPPLDFSTGIPYRWTIYSAGYSWFLRERAISSD